MKHDPLGGELPRPVRDKERPNWDKERHAEGAQYALDHDLTTSTLPRTYYPAIWRVRHELLTRLAQIAAGCEEDEEVWLRNMVEMIERPWHLQNLIYPDTFDKKGGYVGIKARHAKRMRNKEQDMKALADSSRRAARKPNQAL